MKEQLQGLTLTNEQILAVSIIADEAVHTVDRQYGTGFPHFVGGAHNLAYHNGYHSRAVSEDGHLVGEAIGLTLPELITVDVSGAAHDVIQLKPRGQMEAESAAWLEERLRQKRLPGVMAEVGALAIVGTEPVIENGAVVGQVATQLAYPSKSAERVALSVASGDFGRMLRPIGPYLSHKLYQQIKGAQPNEVPPMEDFARYLEAQTTLREDYRFPVAVAERLLGTHRAEVIAYGEHVLGQIERGDITTWEQLEAQDLQFMRDHS